MYSKCQPNKSDIRGVREREGGGNAHQGGVVLKAANIAMVHKVLRQLCAVCMRKTITNTNLQSVEGSSSNHPS